MPRRWRLRLISAKPTRSPMARADRRTFGGVDLLFANTGGPPAGSRWASTTRPGRRRFELLLMSVIRTVRVVVPSMRARGGGAILVGTSSSVKEPIANLALSNVLRSGVTSLAKTLALELAADKIRVNTLIPAALKPIVCGSSTRSIRKAE